MKFNWTKGGSEFGERRRLDELVAAMIKRVEGECSETRIRVETVSNSGTRVEEC